MIPIYSLLTGWSSLTHQIFYIYIGKSPSNIDVILAFKECISIPNLKHNK